MLFVGIVVLTAARGGRGSRARMRGVAGPRGLGPRLGPSGGVVDQVGIGVVLVGIGRVVVVVLLGRGASRRLLVVGRVAGWVGVVVVQTFYSD